jgi:uncharacterized repeat protein (TIGR03943 family)
VAAVNDDARAMALLLAGVTVGFLVHRGTYALYVKVGMRPALLAVAILLVVLGIAKLAEATLARPGPRTGPGRGPLAAWLLLVPVLAVGLVQPTPLGAWTASRQPTTVPATPSSIFPPLERGPDGVVKITVSEFVWRAESGDQGGLGGVPVRLVGMVAPAARGTGGFGLIRFTLSCCAADARPQRVTIQGLPTPPPADTWVEVTGRWQAAHEPSIGAFQPPVLRTSQLRRIPRPTNPYE